MKKLFVILLSLIFTFWGLTLANNSIDEVVSWMHQKWLTIFDNPSDFMATKWLRRDEASKFFVQYAKEILQIEPDTTKTNCNFNDLHHAWPDLKTIIKEACQLWLFQWHNWNFMPTQPLTNAQAITVLIRMIDGYKNETEWHFATRYFEKAKELWIMEWLYLNHTARFDQLTTRGEVGTLIFNSSLLSKKGTSNDTQSYLVTRIIDWDTIEIMSWWIIEKVRLIWIDSPETVNPRNSIECYGPEASAKMTELLLNKKVILKTDHTQNDKDIFNRLLRYVYTEDGIFINERFVKNWYAKEYTYRTKYQYQSDFKSAELYARNNKLWQWADGLCENNNTPNINDIDNNTPNNYVFYTSSHHSARLYYCETDSARKGLSLRHLTSYTSESELLKRYPWKTLNEPCK